MPSRKTRGGGNTGDDRERQIDLGKREKGRTGKENRTSRLWDIRKRVKCEMVEGNDDYGGGARERGRDPQRKEKKMKVELKGDERREKSSFTGHPKKMV